MSSAPSSPLRPSLWEHAASALRSGAGALWQARRSPLRWIRLLWWFALLSPALLAIAGQKRLFLFWILWGGLNSSLVLVGGGWGLLHPRSLRPAWGVIRGFAILMAFLAFFLLLALQDFLTSFDPRLVFSGSALLLSALAIIPVALPCCLLLGALGAGVGAYFARDAGEDISHSARYGVAGWWAAMWLGGSLLAQYRTGVGEKYAAVVWCSAPLLACVAGRIALHVRLNNVGVLARIVGVLDKRLRIKMRFRGKTRFLDFRGGFLGSVAGMALLLSGLMGVFYPVQARLLALLVSFRSAPLLAQLPNSSFGRLLDEGAENPQTAQMVVVRMDEATRRSILQSGSETATQAAIIRTLSRYRCRYIVLPAPLLNRLWQRNDHPTLETPLADDATVQRGLREVPALANAMREAGNVIFATFDVFRPFLSPEMDSKAQPAHKEDARRNLDQVGQLAQAAYRVGFADLDNLEVARLPALRMVWEGTPPPLPCVLFATLQGQTLPEHADLTNARQFRLGKVTLPMTSSGEILVSYFAGSPETAFATVSYQTLLSGASIVPPHNEMEAVQNSPPAPTHWTSPEAFFRDKIVFLEGLDPHLRQTPIGTLTEPELLAHATTTLLSHSIVRRLLTLPMQQVLLTSLLLSALIGHITLRRTPFHSGWRTAVVLGGFIVLCLVAFLFLRIWIDMIVPIIAGLAAYLLIVQFSVAVDKWEASRHRGLLERVWPTEVVDELLAQGDNLELGGERRRLYVLFADVRGFSQFTATYSDDPKLVVATINEYLTAMAEEVFNHGGLLDKFLGDGMLALFGVPKTRPDEAEQAVRAALAMQRASEQISERLRQEGRQPLALGIGLHVGEAVFGLMGNKNRPDLTAIGHAVVVGQRIQTTALGGEVIISNYLYAEVAHQVEAEERPPVQVKGLIEPVRSYRLMAMCSSEAAGLRVSRSDAEEQEAVVITGPQEWVEGSSGRTLL